MIRRSDMPEGVKPSRLARKKDRKPKKEKRDDGRNR